jgi:hypothetical protein
VISAADLRDLLDDHVERFVRHDQPVEFAAMTLSISAAHSTKLWPERPTRCRKAARSSCA